MQSDTSPHAKMPQRRYFANLGIGTVKIDANGASFWASLLAFLKRRFLWWCGFSGFAMLTGKKFRDGLAEEIEF